jgi:hypothetical protein
VKLGLFQEIAAPTNGPDGKKPALVELALGDFDSWLAAAAAN